jgi:hypothetical protein
MKHLSRFIKIHPLTPYKDFFCEGTPHKNLVKVSKIVDVAYKLILVKLSLSPYHKSCILLRVLKIHTYSHVRMSHTHGCKRSHATLVCVQHYKEGTFGISPPAALQAIFGRRCAKGTTQNSFSGGAAGKPNERSDSEEVEPKIVALPAPPAAPPRLCQPCPQVRSRGQKRQQVSGLRWSSPPCDASSSREHASLPP